MRFIKRLLGILPFNYVYAHCDIPCGVYDPTPLQIASHTVLRMTQLLGDVEKEEDGIAREHKIARLTHIKEEHGGKVEDELGTLENDYFKDEHFAAHEDLKDLLSQTVALSIKTRQGIDLAIAQELLEKVLLISEIFYKTKNVPPVRVKSLYPTGQEIVTYTA